jgi:Putative auto-transporter adhesin, head GIN domain
MAYLTLKHFTNMKTASLLLLGSCLAVAATAAACDPVNGIGQVVRKEIPVQEFTGIELKGSMDVVLTPSATRKVEVEAQGNLVDLVSIQVVRGIWTITTEKDYTTNKPFVVHISTPSITSVNIYGSGGVASTGTFKEGEVRLEVAGSGDLSVAFEATRIEAQVLGSGDIVLAGICEELEAVVKGSGDVSAKMLRAQQASARTFGSGDIALNVTNTLDAFVAGSGQITYAGDPGKVNTNVNGSGEVKAAARARTL